MSRIPVLDCGYIELIETWGSDERVIEAARMSTGKGFLGWGNTEKKGDERLLAYLYTNKHTTPFEMSGMTIEVQAPIFVFREWHRHRTQSYNEFSARYSELPDLFYMPSKERLDVCKQSTTNKQSSEIGLDEDVIRSIEAALTASYRDARDRYKWMIDNKVAKEIARLVIPVAQYSKMRASANLWNWLRFLKLRMSSHAQYEIRQYANVVCEILDDKFPRTVELFKLEMKNE